MVNTPKLDVFVADLLMSKKLSVISACKITSISNTGTRSLGGHHKCTVTDGADDTSNANFVLTKQLAKDFKNKEPYAKITYHAETFMGNTFYVILAADEIKIKTKQTSSVPVGAPKKTAKPKKRRAASVYDDLSENDKKTKPAKRSKPTPPKVITTPEGKSVEELQAMIKQLQSQATENENTDNSAIGIGSDDDSDASTMGYSASQTSASGTRMPTGGDYAAAASGFSASAVNAAAEDFGRNFSGDRLGNGMPNFGAVATPNLDAMLGSFCVDHSLALMFSAWTPETLYRNYKHIAQVEEKLSHMEAHDQNKAKVQEVLLMMRTQQHLYYSLLNKCTADFDRMQKILANTHGQGRAHM